jgi:hypothetical protein
MSDTAKPREILMVTTPEGTEFVPEAAFAASAARRMGLAPRLLATDFCTTRDGFQNAVSAEGVEGVVFFDAPEFREVVDGLSKLALEAGARKVVVAGDGREDDGSEAVFDPEVRRAFGGDPARLAAALELRPPDFDRTTTPLDYEVYGGAALLDRATGCSLFGDLDVAALVAIRASRTSSSPCAALARLEGAVASERRVALSPKAAHAPLDVLGAKAREVEWLDRDFFEATLLRPAFEGAEAADRAYLAPLRERGLRQTVRLSPKTPGPMLETLAELGVFRVVFDCDAVLGLPALPQSVATAEDVAAAAELARDVGLEAGVLLVVGLPGETPDSTKARCDVLPFEPSAGPPAAWCRARDLWPPRADRWNREIRQPLRDPSLPKDAFARSFEEALLFVAETQVAALRRESRVS